MGRSSLKNRDRRLKNLKPWKPGQSGNPKGRPPKDVSLTSLLKLEVQKINPDDKAKRTWAELLVVATIRLAVKGNAAALKEVWERMDGRVREMPPIDEEPQKVTVQLVDLSKHHKATK